MKQKKKCVLLDKILLESENGMTIEMKLFYNVTHINVSPFTTSDLEWLKNSISEFLVGNGNHIEYYDNTFYHTKDITKNKNKFIIIDNTNKILSEELINKIEKDNKNQYIILEFN